MIWESIMEYSELFYPGRFAVGPGSVKALASFIDKENLSHGLIVTDAFLASSPVMRAVTAVLDGIGLKYDFFTGVISNPSVSMVDAAAEAFKAHSCDFMIAVGGGSPVDTAKAASLAAANGGSVSRYIGINRSLYPGVPVIAVNTTAGTGAEVTRFFVLTDHEQHTKSITIDDHCLVRLAVSDPELMTALPPDITASTGLDALTHAIEAYCAVNHQPFSDGLALQAVTLINRSLKTAVEEPENIAARTDLCWAASLAGYAFSNSGLGLMHSIGFSIENFCGIPHGQAVGMVMPYVLDFNRRAIPNRVAEIGGACGLDDRDGGRTVRYLYGLIGELPLPTLKEAGLSVNEIPALAEMAMADPTLGANALQPTLAEMTALIESIYCEELK